MRPSLGHSCAKLHANLWHSGCWRTTARKMTVKHANAAGVLHLARVLCERAAQLPLLQHLGWLAAGFRLPRPAGRD